MLQLGGFLSEEGAAHTATIGQNVRKTPVSRKGTRTRERDRFINAYKCSSNSRHWDCIRVKRLAQVLVRATVDSTVADEETGRRSRPTHTLFEHMTGPGNMKACCTAQGRRGDKVDIPCFKRTCAALMCLSGGGTLSCGLFLTNPGS